MHADASHVDEAEPVARREVDHRGDAEVAQVLVIDRVVRGLLEEFDQIRELRDEYAAFLEQRRHAVHQPLEVVDVSDDVVADDRRGAAVLPRDLGGDGFAEELIERRDPGRVGHRRDVSRGLDPEDPHGAAVEGAEERPVVAPDLDDQATLRHKPLRDILRVLSKVRGNRFRRARNVEVVAEHDLRRDRDRQLNVAAGRASRELERVPRFRPPDFIGLDEGVGERLQTEVEDALQRIRLADATTRSIRDALPSRKGSSG